MNVCMARRAALVAQMQPGAVAVIATAPEVPRKLHRKIRTPVLYSIRAVVEPGVAPVERGLAKVDEA